MDIESLKGYRDNATHIELWLTNGMKFTGKITSVSDAGTITLLDKFNKIVTLESSAIIIVNPKEEGWQ